MDPIETIETIMTELCVQIQLTSSHKDEVQKLFENAKRAVIYAAASMSFNVDDIIHAMQPVEIPK